jgi:Na+/melibiose symporter-like transporter
MATPAERIYDAAAAALGAQQDAVTRITSTVAPVGTAAAAAALLIKPALVKVDQAGVLQVAGLVLGAIGVVFVLTAALAVLRGVEMERVEPAKLLEVTTTDPGLLTDGDRFHIETANKLIQTKTENDQALKQLQADFARMTAGLVTEILGFALAAGVHF